MTEPRPAPYPPDTLAKGWRFELDHERIDQSDTWALAPVELRPWLLMLWMMSWRQTPCGTLPNSDEVIAARIGMPLRKFVSSKSVLMRGWWMADDGRLYHDTITMRVLAMLDKRASDAKRAAERRARKGNSRVTPPGEPDPSPPGSPVRVTRDTPATPTEVPPEFDTKHQAVKLIPRTDTQPGVSVDNFPDPSPYGAAFGLLHRLGVIGASPGDPEFKAIVDKGVTDDEWRAAAEKARRKGRTDLPYVVGIVANQRRDAEAMAAGTPAKPATVASVTVAGESTEVYLARKAAEKARDTMTPEQKQAAAEARREALRKLGRQPKGPGTNNPKGAPDASTQ